MKSDTDELFKQLEPPSGGVERFRQRLKEREAPARLPFGTLVIAAVAASAIAIAIIAMLPSAPGPELMASVYQAPEFDRLLGRSLAPAKLSVTVGDTPVAVSEVATTNPKIRIYEIDRE